MPSVLICAGAQKAASTSLTKWFADIPGVALLSWECVAFEGRAHKLRTRLLAEQVSRAAAKGLVPALHRPEIFHAPLLSRRAAAAFPDALPLAVLRSPVDRAVSAWWHYVRIGIIDPSLSLRDCVTQWRLTGGTTAAGQVLSYSLYSPSAKGFRLAWPDAVMIFNEDLLNGPKAVLAEVLDRLDLGESGADELPHVNTKRDVDERAGALPPAMMGRLGFRWDLAEGHVAPRELGWRVAAIATRAAGLAGVKSKGVATKAEVSQADRDAVYEVVESDFDRLADILNRSVPPGWRRT